MATAKGNSAYNGIYEFEVKHPELIDKNEDELYTTAIECMARLADIREITIEEMTAKFAATCLMVSQMCGVDPLGPHDLS